MPSLAAKQQGLAQSQYAQEGVGQLPLYPPPTHTGGFTLPCFAAMREGEGCANAFFLPSLSGRQGCFAIKVKEATPCLGLEKQGCCLCNKQKVDLPLT